MIGYVTIRKFCELTGYTEEAIRLKIKRGSWMENRVWRKAPDGRILISMEGFESWVETGPACSGHQKQGMKSPSPITASSTGERVESSTANRKREENRLGGIFGGINNINTLQITYL